MAKTKIKKVSSKKKSLPKHGDIFELAGHQVQYLVLDNLKKGEQTLLQKESAQMPAVIEAALMLSGGGGIPDPTRFVDYAETYQNVVWVYASAFAVANSLAKIPLKLYRDEKDNDGNLLRTEITEHPILDLLWHPNSEDGWEDLMEAIVVSLELGGDGYIEIVKSTGKMAGIPTELYYVRPDRIKIVPKKDGKGIKGYQFSTTSSFGTRKGIDFAKEDIIHVKYFNPLDDWYGQGSAMAATRAIVLEQYQERFYQKYFENNATPSGVLMTEFNVNKDEADRILREWKAKYSGVDKAHKIALLPLGLKYEKIGSSLAELGVGELDQRNRDLIMTAFGVNDAILGITKRLPRDIYRTQIRHFYENTQQPKAKKIANALTNSLMPLYKDGEKLYLEFDFKDLLAEPYDVRLGRWERAFAIGSATIGEIVADLGGTKIEDEWANKRFIDRKYIPLDIVNEVLLKTGQTQVEPNTDDVKKAFEEVKEQLRELQDRDEEQ